jgi:hypothetical protein
VFIASTFSALDSCLVKIKKRRQPTDSL